MEQRLDRENRLNLVRKALFAPVTLPDGDPTVSSQNIETSQNENTTASPQIPTESRQADNNLTFSQVPMETSLENNQIKCCQSLETELHAFKAKVKLLEEDNKKLLSKLSSKTETETGKTQ